MSSVRQVTGTLTDTTIPKIYPDGAMDDNVLYLVDLANTESWSGGDPSVSDTVNSLVSGGADGTVFGTMTEGGGGFDITTGSQAGVSLPTSLLSSLYTNDNDFVAIAWAKWATVTPAGNAPIFCAGDDHGTDPMLWEIYLRTGVADTVAFCATDSNKPIDYAVTPGSVVQLAVFKEGGVFGAYINGTQIPQEWGGVATTSAAAGSNPDVSSLGAALGDPVSGQGWTANLFAMRIYRALVAKLPGTASDRTAAEVIAADYAAVNALGNFS